MRACVLFPPLRVSRDFIDYPYFADLGAVQAAAVLREAGHEVTLLDALALPGSTLAPLPKREVLLGAPVEEVLERLPWADVYVVAYTPFHRPPSREAMLGTLLKAVAGQGPVVLADLYQSGQHYVEAVPEAVLAAYPEVSALLRYEAEDVLVEVCERTAAGERVGVVRGGEVKDLDRLPLPAWDLVVMENYFTFQRRVVEGLSRGAWAFPVEEASAPLVTSRGCPFRCIHCSSNPGRKPGAPKTQRRYSRAYLARALDQLTARGVRRVHILDELANVNEGHFDGLMEELVLRDLRFEIPNGLRADYVLDRHLVVMRGRLTTLSVSAESGSQRVVEQVVDKRLDLGEIERVCAEAKRVGVATLVHFMIGLPGETASEINETLTFAMKLHEAYGTWPSVQYATPLPGTRLAEAVTRGGKISLPVVDDWGPRFQQHPSVAPEGVSLEQLQRFKWTFEARLAAMQGPKKIILNATYRCNNRCTFCATGTRTQYDGNFERQKELLVKYREAGVTLLDIDGGEPTLNPNLLALVHYARRLGYQKVNVTTNGRMCSYKEFARKLVHSGVTSILFSIHGPDAQTHAQNVGVAEAFEQTCTGVRNVVALRHPRVAVGANVTITKSNWKKLEPLAQLVHDLGLRWFNLQFLTPFGRATSSVCPDTQAAAEEVMKLIDRWRDRMKLQVINLPFCFMPGYETFLVGDLLKLERNMIFVNNDEVNLFDYLRERRVKKEVCRSCPYAIFCGGFYELEDVPEPMWLIEPADLIRPVRSGVPVARLATEMPREA
ncbi:MAG: radical SAM protein [Myxococcales bacterium]|nr:radical SAM protein [Polyangiaceae bacterium]MDW8248751.1 radical SAM protein [Myxococcales bacterium]